MRVYKITNKQNGKIYVGQTKGTLSKRFSAHVSSATRGSKASIIHNAIRKYGRDAFKIELLEECQSFEELDEAERRWIAELNTVAPNGYNIEKGGFCNRAPMSEETRAKLREVRKHPPPGWYEKVCHAARNRSPGWYERVCHAARNRSSEWRRKLSEAAKRRTATPRQRAALAAGARLRFVNGIPVKGEANGRAILTWEKVSEIRDMYASGNFSQEKLASMFGVKQVTVSAIVRHKIWRLNTWMVSKS